DRHRVAGDRARGAVGRGGAPAQRGSRAHHGPRRGGAGVGLHRVAGRRGGGRAAREPVRPAAGRGGRSRTCVRRVMEADLAVRNLVIEYSSGGYPVRPIDGLDLDAASGQLVLLLGASGCGKTTLLSVLAAILKPHSGSVKVGDIEVTD